MKLFSKLKVPHYHVGIRFKEVGRVALGPWGLLHVCYIPMTRIRIALDTRAPLPHLLVTAHNSLLNSLQTRIFWSLC